jgi:hypothetical protein
MLEEAGLKVESFCGRVTVGAELYIRFVTRKGRLVTARERGVLLLGRASLFGGLPVVRGDEPLLAVEPELVVERLKAYL